VPTSTPVTPAPRAGAPPARASASAPATRTVLYFIAYPQRMAGANRSLFELVRNLPPRIRPFVVIAGEGQVADSYRQAGIPCTVLAPGGSLGTYGRGLMRTSRLQRMRIALSELLPFTLKLRRLIVETGADLVHVNDPRGALMAGPAAHLARRPVVAHVRGEIPFSRLARGAFVHGARRLITVSEGVRRTLPPRGREQAVTVYNGIRELPRPESPIPFLQHLRGRGVTVVACFASVVPFKGFHHLLRAAALLRDRGWAERVAFVCVGDMVEGYEKYHAWLAALAAELGVDNVTFTGWQADPFAFYASADVAVLPSVSHERAVIAGEEVDVRGNEGFPRTHLEAMVFGLPVVGTRIAGVPEQVEEGVTGLVCEPSDPAGLAGALEVLLRSPELRRKMGEAGRERVHRLFSTRAYVDGVMAVYDGIR